MTRCRSAYDKISRIDAHIRDVIDELILRTILPNQKIAVYSWVLFVCHVIKKCGVLDYRAPAKLSRNVEVVVEKEV